MAVPASRDSPDAPARVRLKTTTKPHKQHALHGTSAQLTDAWGKLRIVDVRRGRGVIVNMASMLGVNSTYRPEPHTAYAAAKHAVVGLTRTVCSSTLFESKLEMTMKCTTYQSFPSFPNNRMRSRSQKRVFVSTRSAPVMSRPPCSKRVPRLGTWMVRSSAHR